ncbi:3-ketosteroid-delta-1-dehydrogenase, partial [Escherichia coli]
LQMCRGFVVTRRITGKIHTLPSTTPCTAGIKTGRVRAFILCPS